MLAQKRFALVLLDLAFHVLPDLHLGTGDLQLLVQQFENFFQPGQQRQGLQNVLKFGLGSRCQAGGEVGQHRRFVRTEPPKKDLQFLAIQRVQRDQFLDGVDDGDCVGLHLLGLNGSRAGSGMLGEVLGGDHEGQFPSDPAPDAKSLQPFQNDLQMFVVALHAMDAAHGAHGVQLVG